MKDFRKSLAVFPLDGARTFTVDKAVFCASLERMPWGVAPPFEPTPGSVERLGRMSRVLRTRGGRGFRGVFEAGEMTALLALGAYRGGDPTQCSCLFITNGHRLLRRRYGLDPSFVRIPHSGERRANFIKPRERPAGVDPHADVMSELMVFLDDARRVYVDALQLVFGWTINPARVRFSLSEVELSWDRECAVAQSAPTQWWPGFKANFRGAGLRPSFIDENDFPRMREASEYIESDAVLGSTVLTTDGERETLRVDAVKGNGAKLYVKADDLIRFEAELTGDRARDILGRSVRLSSAEDLESDLSELAALPYKTLLSAQAQLQCSTILDVASLLIGFMGEKSGEKVAPIVRALVAGQKVHNEGERFTKQLARLRKLGWVRHRGRGIWTAEPELARALEFLAYRARLPDDPSPV